MNHHKPIIIDVKIKPVKTVDYIKIDFTIQKEEMNTKRQKKIKSILNEISAL